MNNKVNVTTASLKDFKSLVESNLGHKLTDRDVSVVSQRELIDVSASQNHIKDIEDIKNIKNIKNIETNAEQKNKTVTTKFK